MSQEPTQDEFSIGAWRVQPRLHRLLGPDGPRQLEPKVVQVLLRLAERPGEVVSQEELLAAVWNTSFVSPEVVRRAVFELRKAFGDDAREPRVIETIPKGGYRLLAPVERPAAAPAASARPGVRRLAAWLGGAAALALLALAFRHLGGAAPTSPTARPLQTRPLTTYPGEEFMPALSPDGLSVAFLWRREGERTPDLYVKALGSETPLRLTESSEWEGWPAWSPDGGEIAFLRGSQRGWTILIVSALGGPPREVFAWVGRAAAGLDWSPDGRSLVVAREGEAPEGERRDGEARDGETGGPLALFRVPSDRSEDGGEAERLSTPPAGTVGDGSPAFSPDGAEVAFVRTTVHGIQDLYLVPAAGGAERRLSTLARKITDFDWSPDGRDLVFASYWGGAHRLWRLPLAGGEARPVEGAGEHAVDVSLGRTEGRLVYSRYLWDANLWRLTLPAEEAEAALAGGAGGTGAVAAGGFVAALAAEPLIRSTEWDASPDLSPDGARLAFASTRSGSSEIWTCEADGSNPRQLTSFGGPYTTHPRWSPDGRQIAFDSRAGGNGDLYLVAAGGGPPRRLTVGPADELLPTWSRDGRALYFGSNRGGAWQIWKMPAEGGEAVPLSRGGGILAAESPDGRWVYFARYQGSGLWRVPAEGGPETLAVAELEDGHWGHWRLAGRGLYFLARAETGSPLLTFWDPEGGESRPLAALPRWPESPGLALSADGRRLLVAQVDRVESDLMLAEE